MSDMRCHEPVTVDGGEHLRLPGEAYREERRQAVEMGDILIISFSDLDQARAGMAALRRLADEGSVTLRSAAVVVREASGRFWIPEGEQHPSVTGTVAGGGIGALLGASLGPAGAVIGGTTGAVLGSVVDSRETDASGDLVTGAALQAPPGSTVVVADADETSPGAVDAAMAVLNATVIRRAPSDVASDIEASQRRTGT